MTSLERGYRRLLAWYPAGHRAVYGEEMLGVLMAGSAPGQRLPRARETFDLLAFALRARLRAALPAGRSPAWNAALEAFGFLGCALAATVALHASATGLAYQLAWSDPTMRSAGLATVWTLAATAAGLRLRRTAAVLATLAALAQAFAVAARYPTDPSSLVTNWWLVVLAVTAAGSLVALPRPAAPTPETAPARRPLGVGWRIAVAVAVLLAAGAPLTQPVATFSATVDGVGLVIFTVPPPHTLWLPGFPFGDGRPSTVLTGLVLLVVLATVLLRLTPMVRRRVLALAAPAATVALVVALVFNGYLVSTVRFDPPVYLVAPQWIVLVLTPVLVFAVGAWLVGRHERRIASGALLT